MTKFTRSQILENRKKWIDRLKRPESKKYVGSLSSPTDPEAMCCLGHACEALIPEMRSGGRGETVTYAGHKSGLPRVAIEMLGTFDGSGDISPKEFEHFVDFGQHNKRSSLMTLNDLSEIVPQEIGTWLETVIEGGEGTPFKPLSEYPEEISYENE